MAEIGLELNRIRQISDEIKGLDENLISRYFNELYGILNGIESTVNQDDNVYGTVGRITRNADNIAQKLGSSLKSLENFIDTQLEDYSRNENTAYDRLRAVLEKMAKMLGLDVKSLKIDSPSTVVNPTVSGGSSPSYVTPAAAAMGAGALGTMGYAGGQFLSDAHRDALMRQAEMEGRIRDAYNVSHSVTPEPITYPADSIPSLNRSGAVGPDGHYHTVWVGEDNRIYDENGDLMTSMYMTKNGYIVETADMEYYIKMLGSEKESYEFYRKAYAFQNGIKYEQVKDEYLTPEFKAKCDSGFINQYMPADGTDLDVAKKFKAVAESRVPGITGGLGDETPAGNGVPEVAKNVDPGVNTPSGVNPNMGVGANTEHAPSTSKDPNLIKDRFGAQYGGKAEAHDIRNTPSNGDIVNLPGNPNEKPKVNNLPGNPNEDVEVTPLSNNNEVSRNPSSANSGGQVPSKNGGSSVANSGSSSRNDSRGTANGALGKRVYFSDLPPSAPTNLNRSDAASRVFGTDAYVKGNTFVDKSGKALGTVSGNTIIDVNKKPVGVVPPNGIVSPTTGGSSASAGSLSHSEVASRVYGTDAYVIGNTVIDKNGRMLGLVNGNVMVDTRGNTVAVGTPAGIKNVSSSYTGTVGGSSGTNINNVSRSNPVASTVAVGSSTPGSTPLPDSIPGFGNQSTSVFTNPGKPVTATPTPAAIKSNIPGKGSSTGSYSGIAQLFQ